MKAGAKVKGSYMGNAISGVVVSVRPLTVKTDGCCEVIVHLDSPVTVFQKERERLCMYVKFDGTKSAYTKSDEHLEAVA